MITIQSVLGAITLALAASLAAAGQYQTSPNVGGKGPGLGHDYRRHASGPETRGGGGPRDSVGGREQAPPVTAGGPLPYGRMTGDNRYPGLGYPGYPRDSRRLTDRYRGFAPPSSVPRDGHGQRRNRRGLGYGYPGYRGQGGSPYPRHRQYGNPPGIPRGPTGYGAGN